MTAAFAIVGMIAGLHLLPRHWIDAMALRVAMKIAPIGLLVILSIVWSAPVVVTLALMLCLTGDAFLEINRAETATDRSFIAGLTAFLLGHVAYILGFSSIADFAASQGILLLLAVFALVMGTVLWRRTGALRIPVMVYIAVICLMVAVTTTSGSLLLAAGGLAFMVSDTILSLEVFVLDQNSRLRPATGFAVWVLYVLAQILLLAGAVGIF